MLKPCFSASKVATLIGHNPFQPAFQELLQTMAQLGVPLCLEGTTPGGERPEVKLVMEQHLQEVVKPHISSRTTVEDLQKLEQQLSILGPLGPQAAQEARKRFGQVAEQSSVVRLEREGFYVEGQYKKVEFEQFYLCGRTDGMYNGKIVEIKNRRHKFLGVTSYERPQFECYMRLFGFTDLYLCESLKKGSGLEQKLTLVQSDDRLWCIVEQRLNWIAQFIEEVRERPFLQHLDEKMLEQHYNMFLSECQGN
jgi:hypothetical protein